MDSQSTCASKDDIWRIQETLGEISAAQAQHLERIMRLERRRDDDGRVKSVWGPSLPFTNVLGSPHSESTLNPTAEAFRNFDTEAPTALMTTLSLDNQDESRRAAASRANSVRFDESANNHYGASSRQSIDLPTRTGSGLGSHPLSERSLSHRSDGKGSTVGFGQRNNSFGLEQSRLLGSIHNSPRVSGNPPPGFFVLGPFPAIVRCWLTPNFSKESLLYTALCTGSYSSCVASSLIEQLGFGDRIFEQENRRRIKLSVYLTDAKIQYASLRSGSPAPHVPTITTTFDITETSTSEKSIQIIVGSDALREHGADILFSQDKVTLLDDENNQLSMPLVRPEDEATYTNLMTIPSLPGDPFILGNRQSSFSNGEQVGVIGRPARLSTDPTASSPTMVSPSVLTSAAPSDIGDSRRSEPASDGTGRSSTEQPSGLEDPKSATSMEKAFPVPLSKSSSGVWANSWRATSSQAPPEAASTSKAPPTYSRAGTSRPMKILRPSKPSSTTVPRIVSVTQPNGTENTPLRGSESERKTSQPIVGEGKPVATKANPIGSASAFGWLNSSQSKKTAAGGE